MQFNRHGASQKLFYTLRTNASLTWADGVDGKTVTESNLKCKQTEPIPECVQRECARLGTIGKETRYAMDDTNSSQL